MIKRLVAAAALLMAFAPAQATTYLSSRAIGAGSVNLSITTDNTIGALTAANITAYSIMINDPSGTLTLTKANSGYAIAGLGLSATATNLVYDFSQVGYALFQFPTVGSSGPLYCLQGSTSASNCFDNAGYGGPAEGLSTTGLSSIQRAARSGSIVIASATGAVPEPASWALMIVGFGLVGAATRRRRPVVAGVRCAAAE